VDELAALIEANVAAFLLEMGAAGGGVEREDREVHWTVGGSPIGYHNAIVRFDVDDEDRARTIVDEWSAELGARGVPGSCHLTPSMRPAGLQALFAASGFEDGGDEPAMTADLRVAVDVPSTDLAISVIADADGMRAYRDVLADGFGEGPKEADWVAAVFSTIGFDGRWQHYVGHVDGRAVATTSMLLTPPVAGIYFVCTRPEHRGRGYGAAITHHAMSGAATAGASYAVLGSSPMGQRIYEQLGFRTVFSYRLMEWEP